MYRIALSLPFFCEGGVIIHWVCILEKMKSLELCQQVFKERCDLLASVGNASTQGNEDASVVSLAETRVVELSLQRFFRTWVEWNAGNRRRKGVGIELGPI